MQPLDRQFWTQQYQNGTTNWDMGYPSTPLKEFIDSLTDKDLKILVPGAGNAYEVEYLWNNGFKNIYVLDISPKPLENFKKRNPTFPDNQMLLLDFFDLKETFDLVLEQTFFCAIDPKLRQAYADQMNKIIVHGGKLAGVMFGKHFEKAGPPFGGTKDEYLRYFEPYFNIEKMDLCLNSIPPRAGNELWVEMVRK
jgi:SAM-dependent methyltransferase